MIINTTKMLDDVIKKKVEALSAEDLLPIQKYNIYISGEFRNYDYIKHY